MGKAKIISGGPAGLYNIELVKETAKIAATIAAINARLPLLTKAIDAALLERTAAGNVLNTKRGALDGAVGKWILKQMTADQVSVVQAAYLAALAIYNTKSVAYSLLQKEQESKTKEKTLLLKALEPEYRNNVWCADLTEDLAPGEEVGTIEVNGESSIAPIIYPGGEYDILPDAKLQPTQASTPAGVFYNLAIFAGWQCWRPTYRVGTITTISGDFCNVRLDIARSSAWARTFDGQNLNINPRTVDLTKISPAIEKINVRLAQLKILIPVALSEKKAAESIVKEKKEIYDKAQGKSEAEEDAAAFVYEAAMAACRSKQAAYNLLFLEKKLITNQKVVLEAELVAKQKTATIDSDGRVLLSTVPIAYMDGLDGEVFVAGDRVVVEFIDQSWAAPIVIGFESHPRGAASSNYYIFYKDGATLKIVNCTYGNKITVLDTKSYNKINTTNFSTPVIFHLKRFTHNVPAGSTIVARDLYFIATSLYLNPNPYFGWVNFARDNPTFPLVTNNANTKITLTPKVLADLNYVNHIVNTTHAYINEPENNDYWWIMTEFAGGDCEDFALTKAKMLLDMGYPASALHIECGDCDEGGHTWLVVQTTDGDYALDLNSDPVIRNTSVMFGGKPFYGRRRQIGSNWAFISPFGWLVNSYNSASKYFYILDPLLNIIHPLSSSGAPESYLALFSGSSVNFSEDNNSIHVADAGVRKTYKLNENKLDLISQSNYVYGFVERDGSFLPSVSPWTCDVISIVGGFAYSYIYGAGNPNGGTWPPAWVSFSEYFAPPPPWNVETGDPPSYTRTVNIVQFLAATNPETILSYCVIEPHIWVPIPAYLSINNTGTRLDRFVGYKPDILVNKIFGNPFCFIRNGSTSPKSTDFASPFLLPITDYIISSFGETIDLGSTNPYIERGWSQIDTDTLLIQSFRLERSNNVNDNIKRMYKDGVSNLSTVIAAVGTTEANLLGLVYIPSTNRFSNIN